MALVESALKAQLFTIFYDLTGKTGEVKAGELGNAIDTHTKTGTPMTMHSGAAPKGLAGGQNVVAFSTTVPGMVTGDGLGGIDSSSPGAGLSSGKATLKSDLFAVFSKTDGSMTADKASTEIAAAITKYLKTAKVMTSITATIPPGVTVPGPSGPVGIGSYSTSCTGGLETATAGAGLDKDASIVDVLKLMLQNYDNMPKDYDEAATKWSDMIHDYYKTAKVQTTDSGTAGGGTATVVPVNVPPTPFDGLGVTGPSPIVSGSGTGTIS
jgi:hypothetical protein